MTRAIAPAITLFIIVVLSGSPVNSALPTRTYEVGPTRLYKTPSIVADMARDGDKVVIDAGEYKDCAVWRANGLLIEGRGRVVLRDATCQGKGIFVVAGSGVTIRNIIFRGARVPDGNGAGIRLDGADLTVDNSQFVGNEDGILTGPGHASRVIVRNSTFIGNGSCRQACAHGIYAGELGLLQVEHCTFRAQMEGHHIKSRALRTEIIGNTIEDGPNGTASYLVDLPNGGSLVLRDNVMEKGPRSGNRSAAVSIGAEGVHNPTPELVIEGNRFRSDMPEPTIFVRNLTKTAALLHANTIKGRVTPLSGPGTSKP